MIRPASAQDLDCIVAIEVGSFPTPWPRHFLEQHLPDGGFWVYELEERVAGYVIVSLKTPSLFERMERRTMELLRVPPPPERLTGHILNLATEPARRRRGIGSALLQRGLQYLQQMGARGVQLEVRTDNAAAIRLYQRFGFTIRETIRHYYHNGDDAFVMERSLER